MKRLLEDLQKSKIVKVTGSYADGTQNDFSDIDFYVKPDHPECEFRGDKRNIVKIIDILNRYNIKWHSQAPLTISTIGCKNNIEKELEFSELYKKRLNKLKEITIEGVNFKTY